MSRAERLVTPQMLRDLLILDESTGHMTWRQRLPSHFQEGRRSAAHRCANWNAAHAGEPAFKTIDPRSGYWQGFVLGKLFSAARVVYALHTGAWPTNHIDHINGNRTDNRPANLRDVSRGDNMRNRTMSGNNSSGATGVSMHLGKFDAYITVAGKKKHLGRFVDFDAALAMRKLAEREHGYHPNHGRRAA